MILIRHSAHISYSGRPTWVASWNTFLTPKFSNLMDCDPFPGLQIMRICLKKEVWSFLLTPPFDMYCWPVGCNGRELGLQIMPSCRRRANFFFAMPIDMLCQLVRGRSGELRPACFFFLYFLSPVDICAISELFMDFFPTAAMFFGWGVGHRKSLDQVGS